MLKRVKTTGHWLFENGYPALFWAGLTVGTNLLLFERYFDEHSCEKTGRYSLDIAKNLFWAVFVTRLIILPTVAKALTYIIPTYKLPKRTTVNRLETEFNDGIETALFVFETARDFRVPIWIGCFISLPAVWPIFCSLYKFAHPNFVRGPTQDYAHIESPTKKWFCIVFEGFYNLLSLGSATSFLVSLLFNILYNTTHPDPYRHEESFLVTLIGVFSIVGGLSIAGKKTYHNMHYLEAAINTFYYLLNISASSAACLDPDAFSDSGFANGGWKYVLVFGLISLGFAFIGGFHGTENVYVKHKKKQSKEGHEKKGGWLSYWNKEKRPDITGLKCPNRSSRTFAVPR